MRPSLVERARKRKVRPKKDRNWWLVDGSQALNDSYPDYDVHLHGDGTFWCSCQGNRGGEYRTSCSHRTAVILWREDHDDPWDQIVGESSDLGESDSNRPTDSTEPERHDSPTPVSKSSEGADDQAHLQVVETAAPSDSLSDDEDPEPDELILPPTASLSQPSDPSVFDPYDLDWDNPPVPQIIAHNPDDFPLPDKFVEFRPDQWKGIIEVLEHLDDGKKVVFVSAPTGSGKSLIAATVPQLLGTPFIYTCTTLVLQDQVINEFEYAKVIKGRSNYRTLDDPDLTTEECTNEKTTLPACVRCPGWGAGSTWTLAGEESGMYGTGMEGSHCFHCHPVHACPYQIAKVEARYARMAVLNTSYLLAETNHLKDRSSFSGWPLVVIDEADTLEAELMRFIEVEISPARRRALGIGLPERKTVDSAWVDWVRDVVIPAIDRRLIDLPIKSPDLFGEPDQKTRKERKSLIRMRLRMKQLLAPPPGVDWEPDPDDPDAPPPASLSSGWVYTGYEEFDDRKSRDESRITVKFKPITVRDYAREYLWANNQQFILMSATFISPEQMAYDLGLEEGEWAVVEIPSSFEPQRRPLVVKAETYVTEKTKASAYPILVNQLEEIMADHPNERILVHSNSYKLTKELFYEGRRRESGYGRMVTYMNAHEREQALNDYLDKPNAVLIAPSFDRGVDLQGDDCRVIVIAKVPYPYLGDKQVSARLYGTGRRGKMWYRVETIRSIVQMTGRGMRSKDDWVKTYILDKQFLKLYWENQKLFPQWWRQALVFDENDPKWRTVLRELGAA